MNEIKKLSTKIPGLGKVLKGGLDYYGKSLIVAVRGNANTHKTLFGLQLAYGFAMSLKEKNVVSEPHLCCFSMCHDKEFLDELMINTLISAYTQVLIKKEN